MGARQTRPRATRLGWLGRFSRLARLVRRWRFDRNPLRRDADRLETVVLALLVAVFLIGTPFAALAAGAWVHGLARQEQLAQQASWHQVTAVVRAVTPVDAGQAAVAWQARAQWTAPDGTLVTQEVPVPAGTTAGGTVQVWTDQAGDLTSPPLLDSQVAGQATLAEVGAVFAVATVLILAGAMTRRALNRRRLAAWDADWRATEPRWTTRA